MLLALQSRWKPNWGGRARRCRRGRGSFPRTARRNCSAWVFQRAPPRGPRGRPSAGRAAWCRRSGACRSTIESGLTRARSRPAWSRSEPPRRYAPLPVRKNKKRNRFRKRWRPGCSRLWPLRRFLLPAFRGKPVLLHFRAPGSADALRANWPVPGVQLLSVRVDEVEDLASTYNILYRYLFDRHRDLGLPTAFLIDGNGDIVKVYQGPVAPAHVNEDSRRIPRSNAERLAKALPFRGVSETYEFGRNSLSLGSAFFQRGYFDQAETAFRLALRDDPASAEAHYGLGSVYLKQEKTREARDSFERAVKLSASYPDTLPNAWNNLGLLATREGHMDEAAGHFQEALRVSPDYWIALENLGNA